MPLDPVPRHLMAGNLGIELAPEILIEHRLAVGLAPISPAPAVDPLVDALHHVLRIHVQIDATWALERAQRLKDSHHFHSVVGRLQLAAVQGLFRMTRTHQCAPAARAGIALAGTVGPDFNVIFAIAFQVSFLSKGLCDPARHSGNQTARGSALPPPAPRVPAPGSFSRGG